MESLTTGIRRQSVVRSFWWYKDVDDMVQKSRLHQFDLTDLAASRPGKKSTVGEHATDVAKDCFSTCGWSCLGFTSVIRTC